MKNSRTGAKLVRFLISGSTAALVEFVSFIIFLNAGHFTILAAQTISFSLGLITSYVMNRRWVFKSNGSIKHELPKYIILAVANLLLSNALLQLLHTLGIVVWLAKIFVMGSIAAWNFLIFQKLIFKNQDR